jgi:hypothetical protein
VGDGTLARLGTLHGVAHRRGQNAAHFTGFAQRQQACQVVLMQARTCRVMDQHPLGASGSLNARQHGIGALGAAINYGNLWVVCQRQLRKAGIAGTDGDDHVRHPRVRQQRRHGVLKDRFIAN